MSVAVQSKRIILTTSEIDNPEALAKYYRLLLSIVRVITSVVISRGSQNEQTIESAKAFLMENRPLVVSMFKRQARIGGVSFDTAGVDIEDLVELFMLLITMTGFLDVSYADEHRINAANISSSMKSNEIPKSHGVLLSRDFHLKCNTLRKGSRLSTAH